MAEQQRVVGAFDDPIDADRAKHRLESVDGEVEESAPEDSDVAFEATRDRGESAERQPDTTVAVETDESSTREAERILRDAGAELVEVEPEPPASEPQRKSQ